jgi:choline kinase
MFRQPPVAQTVILAAGYGSRLRREHRATPKPLVVLRGRPLIAHALEHAAASGCTKAVVVIAHEADRVRAAVDAMAPDLDVRFVRLADASSPNGVSLLAAEPLAEPQFFLQMVDHVFGDVVLPRLTARPFTRREAGRVLVDRNPDVDLEDATKIRLAGDRVIAIGKTIDPWDVVDAGCFVLTSAVFDALGRVPRPQCSVSAAMQHLATAGSLSAVDLDATPWADVDTPEDLLAADRVLAYRVGEAEEVLVHR